MDCVGAKQLSIPPRGQDLSPTENIFHQLKRKLGDDALERNIVKENFHHFSKRVKETVESLPKEVIDRTIASMDKRIEQIIKFKDKEPDTDKHLFVWLVLLSLHMPTLYYRTCTC